MGWLVGGLAWVGLAALICGWMRCASILSRVELPGDPRCVYCGRSVMECDQPITHGVRR